MSTTELFETLVATQTRTALRLADPEAQGSDKGAMEYIAEALDEAFCDAEAIVEQMQGAYDELHDSFPGSAALPAIWERIGKAETYRDNVEEIMSKAEEAASNWYDPSDALMEANEAIGSL